MKKIIRLLLIIAVLLTVFNFFHLYADSFRGYSTTFGGGELMLVFVVPSIIWWIRYTKKFDKRKGQKNVKRSS